MFNHVPHMIHFICRVALLWLGRDRWVVPRWTEWGTKKPAVFHLIPSHGRRIKAAKRIYGRAAPGRDVRR